MSRYSKSMVKTPVLRRIALTCAIVVVITFPLIPQVGVNAKTVLTVCPGTVLIGQNQLMAFPDPKFLFKEYQKSHPDIEFRIIEGAAPSNADSMAKFILSASTEPGVDVAEVYLAMWPDLLSRDLVAPMPDDLAREAQGFFYSAPLGAMYNRDGVLCGFPSEYNVFALVYNQAIFDRSGIAKLPSTWEELRLTAIKLTRSGPDGSITQFAIALPWAPWCTSGIFYSFLWANGGTYLDEKGLPHLTDSAAIETLEFLQSLYAARTISLDWDLFRSGRAAIVGQWNQCRESLRQSRGIDYSDVASISLPPRRIGGKPGSYQYGWGLFVPSSSKHKKEAWEFLRWLTMERHKTGLTFTGKVMACLGCVPTNPSDFKARDELKKELFYRGFLESIRYAKPDPPFPDIVKRQDVLFEEITRAITGGVAPTMALENAQKRTLEILKKAGVTFK